MFPERLRALRHGKHITLEVLAKDLNELFPDENQNTSNQIGNWERGVRTPSYLEVQKLAEYFDVSMDYICGRAALNEYDLSKLFLSGRQLSFDHKVLSGDDRYEIFQLMDGYFHGKKRRVVSDTTEQEELDLNWNKKKDE
ncbi:helix-turn-helix domain-containing protein [Pediococcus stilesii]|uniref:Helix-turn-helix transcriptional regulator n=1 Tax=Pediococcus stilesii TaxID=331679 RepID=A0A0R2L3S9_9LACO|nr:helix-turn-helix transcriptional regulator [Pediococcus stilesii]KRN93882.1 XRE family transcriptional regulator [Pediococcus stilesii]TLQ05698.1 helix-turn-helix transcriptional regulator [Pediococcus stilesii]